MNNYILPKNNFKLTFSFSFSFDNDNPDFISHTMITSLNYINTHIKKYNNYEVDEISKKINPYEFIFSNVSDTFIPISKIKPQSNIYYELYEIIFSCFIFEDIASSKNNISIFHIGNNSMSTNLLIDTLRDSYNDNKLFTNFNVINKLFNTDNLDNADNVNNVDNNIKPASNNIDLGFFECNSDSNNSQINKLIIVLYIICLKMNKNGSIIIKLNDLTQKSTIDVLYILNNMFDKISLTKPLLSNILTNENFVICKNFIGTHVSLYLTAIEPIALKIINNTIQDNKIISILQNKIPILFLNKIEEYNAIFGQQQLESKDQLISIINNKNRYDKIESLKRNNIQKGIIWCEKYQIPHNKFSDKINIFLNIKSPDEAIVSNYS
jgi:hypothetical protein